MREKIKVGIIGCGFVGGALKTWLEENNAANVEVLVSDPPKGHNDDLSQIDVAFPGMFSLLPHQRYAHLCPRFRRQVRLRKCAAEMRQRFRRLPFA